ncbi:MAG: hypothetical protein Kow0031_24660 [Anaerolineae bacterium]
MLIQRITLWLIILAGFALRLRYLTTAHPFFDEYTTVLASRQILQHGWPLLPSGLFYEHGLLATYLIAPFTALFINSPIESWQPAQWGLMPARWPSLLVSTATIPLIFAVARRAAAGSGYGRQAAAAGLIAAGLFAISPEGIVWGARARMYALATLLVLLTVYLAYRGSAHPAPARYRWALLAALLAALLTQLGALLMLPPLLIAMLTVGWLSARAVHPSSLILHPSSFPRPWFLQKSVIPQLVALALVIALGVWVKRLGQPLGAPALSDDDSGSFITEMAGTVAYQTTFHFTLADTETFLARQFGVEHHLWLATIALAALVVNLALWAGGRMRNGTGDGRRETGDRTNKATEPPSPFSFLTSTFLISNFQLFLWLVFGLIIVEMVTLLEPFRRNPRYLVMFLPLFYLIAGSAITYMVWLLFTATAQFLRLSPRRVRLAAHPLTALLVVVAAAAIGANDIRVAMLTPEPDYPAAFARVLAEWQPGDVLLTMNTPAAELYLGRVDGFTVQNNADQFLLNRHSAPVDRWLGAPWLGRAADFSAALDAAPRAWFVSDTIRQPVYYRGDWQAIVNTQMEQVWAADNALLYRTRADRAPLPLSPATRLDATLGEAIRLLGYTLEPPKPNTADTELKLTLFWEPLTEPAADYTVFLHLRNPAGATVAQRDGQPLEGAYPTSQWLPGETVIDPITLPLFDGLPRGRYTLLAGLYRLDTLERLPVANDSSGENAVLLGEVVMP